MCGAKAMGSKLGRRGLLALTERRCKGEELASSVVKVDGKLKCWGEDEIIELSSNGRFWSWKSMTDSLQTAHCIAFSPTILRALVRHPEHRGCSHGLRIANRPPSRPQTEQAVDEVTVAFDFIFAWKNDSPKCCGTHSVIVERPEPKNGSCKEKDSAEGND
jgi:hypothetical protein